MEGKEDLETKPDIDDFKQRCQDNSKNRVVFSTNNGGYIGWMGEKEFSLLPKFEIDHRFKSKHGNYDAY